MSHTSLPLFRGSESSRRGRGSRHGRGIRSSVTGPYLDPLYTRITFFEGTIRSTIDYLRNIWPDELHGVVCEIAPTVDGNSSGLPESSQTLTDSAHDSWDKTHNNEIHGNHVERWRVIDGERRIVFYRLAIQRLGHIHRNDELHQRMVIESCVFGAVAEFLGKDPWDLTQGRFRQ